MIARMYGQQSREDYSVLKGRADVDGNPPIVSLTIKVQPEFITSGWYEVIEKAVNKRSEEFQGLAKVILSHTDDSINLTVAGVGLEEQI